jgi:hypothetical protein
MAKITKLIPVIVLSLLLIVTGYVLASSVSLDGNYTLYSTSAPTAIGATNFCSLALLRPTANDTAKISVDELGASGAVALGNSSVIQLVSIDPSINAIPNSTWTIQFFASCNVSDKAQLGADVLLLNDGGTTNATLVSNRTMTAAASLVSTGNTTFTVSFNVVSATGTNIPADSLMYLKILWYSTKTDATHIHIDLYHAEYLNDTATLNYSGLLTAVFTLTPSVLWGSMILIIGVVVMFAIVIYVVTNAIKKPGQSSD